MAIGDQAKSVGYSIVPDTGENGRVRWGAREINRTRDFIAAVKKLIPVGQSGYQKAVGIRWGGANPSGGNNGDIYFKII